MTRSGSSFLALRNLAAMLAGDGKWEPVFYLSPDSEALLAGAIADLILPVAADEGVLAVSAVRAATLTLTDVVNTAQAHGVMLILDVTAVTALQTLTLELQVKDPASAKYFTWATTGAIGVTATLVGTYTLVSQPGLGSLIGSLTTLFGTAIGLPYTWRARIVHSGGGNFTYSLGRILLH